MFRRIKKKISKWAQDNVPVLIFILGILYLAFLIWLAAE